MAFSREMLACRIRDAMHECGIAQQELANEVGMDPTALSKALAGRRDFKSVEVALIAEHLRVPTDVLLADDGVEATPRPAVAAARVQDGVSPVVDQATSRAGQLRDVDALLNDLGYPDESVLSLPAPPDIAPPVGQGQALADVARRQAGGSDEDLPQEPDDLAAWVEDAFGVDICMTALPTGLDGLALTSGRLRLAVVTSGVAATRQRFTIAHELCHLACGDGSELTVDEDLFGSAPEERRANAFAAAFLMPAEAVRTAAEGNQIDEDLVVELLGRFRVSLDALAFRMHNVGVVDAQGRDRVRAMASARIALRPGRVDDLQARNDRRVPGRLLVRAMDAFAAGDLGIRQLAVLLDTDPERLLDELSPSRFATEPDDDDQVYAL